MRRVRVGLATLAVLAALCFCNIPGYAEGLPFFTVEEYNQLHPEQIELEEDFNALVTGPAHHIISHVPRQVRVAFIYPGKQISDYWKRSVDSFKKRLAEIGVAFIIDEYYTTPGDELSLQERQIRQALKNNPDYLVFTLDTFRHRQIIAHIITQGRPKVILQNITTPLRSWEGKQPLMYVGFDHIKGARMLADYFRQKTGGTGSYGMLYFTHGYVSTMRGNVFHQYVTRKNTLKQVDAAFTDGKQDIAEQAASRMLKEHKLKFFYACATDTALGAIRAIKEEGLTGKVLINGWGGGSAELDALRAGDLDVTVMRMNDDNGVAMAEAIRLDMEGKTAAIPQIFSGDMVLVEKGISQAELDSLIKRAFRYSGN